MVIKTLQHQKGVQGFALNHCKLKAGRLDTEYEVESKCQSRSFDWPAYMQFAWWGVLQWDGDLADSAYKETVLFECGSGPYVFSTYCRRYQE